MNCRIFSDDKEYGALLAYNFSHDMDKITRDHVRLSIHLVRDLLESKGYRVHDENKDGFISGSKWQKWDDLYCFK